MRAGSGMHSVADKSAGQSAANERRCCHRISRAFKISSNCLSDIASRHLFEIFWIPLPASEKRTNPFIDEMGIIRNVFPINNNPITGNAMAFGF